MLTPERYKYILWDWNGTLLDDAWLCVDVMNGMLKERDLPLRTLDQYKEIFGFPVKDYYVTLGFDFDQEPFEEVGVEFVVRYNRRQKETSLHPGVFHILQYFRQLGYPQYILSAREETELVTELHAAGVSSFFTGIFGQDDHYAHGKSEVGIRLLRETKINPREAVFIGDTCHDAEVAEEMGVDCILIPNGHHTARRLGACTGTVVTALEELETIFNTIRTKNAL